MSVNPYLLFTGTCRQTVTRYHEVLGGQLDLMTVADMHAGAEPPPRPPTPDLIIPRHPSPSTGDETPANLGAR